MYARNFIKLLCSIPIILITLYYIPFLGICLLLFRTFIYDAKKDYNTQLILIICGILILFPYGAKALFDSLKIDFTYLDSINNSDVYPKLMDYSKLLIIVGVIFMLLTYAFNKIFGDLSSKIHEGLTKAYNDSVENDYKAKKEVQEKMANEREKVKNYHVVKCPNCGADNEVYKAGTSCKYCRTKLK